jgi:hypothetical protein
MDLTCSMGFSLGPVGRGPEASLCLSDSMGLHKLEMWVGVGGCGMRVAADSDTQLRCFIRNRSANHDGIFCIFLGLEDRLYIVVNVK